METMVLDGDIVIAVLQPGPSLDFRSAPDFRRRCEKLLEEGKRHFIIDLSSTGILDSTGLGVLIVFYKWVQARGGRFALASPTGPVRSVLGLTRSDEVFGVCGSIEEAAAMLSR